MAGRDLASLAKSGDAIRSPFLASLQDDFPGAFCAPLPHNQTRMTRAGAGGILPA